MIYGEGFVEFARHSLKRLPILKVQGPTLVADGAGGLHCRGDEVNTGTAHAEVLADALLSYVDYVRVQTVGNEQQPNSQALLQKMQHCARRAL